MIYYLGGYFLINTWASQRTDAYHLSLKADEMIPFVPVFILGYMMIFLILALTYLLVDELTYWKKIMRAFFFCVTLHFVIFAVFPVEYHLRTQADPQKGWLHFLVDFYYFVDLPFNNFPSLHVSNAFLCAFLMHRYRHFYAWIFYPMAILVAASVLLIKQHFIADVATGVLVAWILARPSRLRQSSPSRTISEKLF